MDRGKVTNHDNEIYFNYQQEQKNVYICSDFIGNILDSSLIFLDKHSWQVYFVKESFTGSKVASYKKKTNSRTKIGVLSLTLGSPKFF